MHTNHTIIHRLDLIAGNGKPYRFNYDPGKRQVTYYDRSVTLDPGDDGYGSSDHNGYPRCGPALGPSWFDAAKPEPLAGETEEYDIDRRSVALVGAWIAHINEYTGS